MDAQNAPGYAEGILAAMAAVRGEVPVKVLRGYLDVAAKPPRLYAGLDLSAYVELDGIVSVQPSPDPTEPSLVWVKEDLQLDLRVPGRDLYGALLLESPEIIFSLTAPETVMAYSCARPKVTSHTIGWCAAD